MAGVTIIQVSQDRKYLGSGQETVIDDAASDLCLTPDGELRGSSL